MSTNRKVVNQTHPREQSAADKLKKIYYLSRKPLFQVEVVRSNRPAWPIEFSFLAVFILIVPEPLKVTVFLLLSGAEIHWN